MRPSNTPYDLGPDPPSSILREGHLETGFIGKLQSLKYEYRPDIRDRASLERNFREKFEALNRVHLTDSGFSRLMEEIVEYKNDPGNGYARTLLCFLQLFIVSNRDNTYCFANNNARHSASNAAEQFLVAASLIPAFCLRPSPLRSGFPAGEGVRARKAGGALARGHPASRRRGTGHPRGGARATIRDYRIVRFERSTP